MALLVLFSSMSFGVSKHYCADEVASVSYFVADSGCGMEALPVSCETTKTQHIEKKSCCKTEFQLIDGSDFLQKDDFSIVKIQLESYLIPVVSDLSFQIFDTNNNAYNFYSSPTLLKDRTVLFETYLI